MMHHDQIPKIHGTEEGSSARKHQGGQRLEIRTPRVDLFETDEIYYIRLSLPGVRKENLNIRYNDRGDLEIEGKVATAMPEKVKKIITQEIYQGPFYRIVQIPNSVDRKSTRFSYQNGILEVFVEILSTGG